MSGGNDADIDVERLAGADALNRFFLQDPQELGLHFEADVADFIKEEGAAVGQFEAADLVAMCAGERAFDVADEFAFEEVGGEGGAVNLDVGLGGAWAGFVNGASEKLLAGAALAAQEDHGVGGGDFADERQELAHDRARADDATGVRQRGAIRLRLGNGTRLRLLHRRLDGGLPKLRLQRQNTPLLFRDLIDLGLQVLVQMLDGAMLGGAFQGDDRDRRQQVPVLGPKRRVLGPQHQDGHQRSFAEERLGDFEAHLPKLALRRREGALVRRRTLQTEAVLHGLDQRRVRHQVGEGRPFSLAGHKPKAGGLVLAQVDRPARNAQRVRNRRKQPLREHRRIDQLRDRLTHLLQGLIELRFVA